MQKLTLYDAPDNPLPTVTDVGFVVQPVKPGMEPVHMPARFPN